jgi:hypothetical protein
MRTRLTLSAKIKTAGNESIKNTGVEDGNLTEIAGVDDNGHSIKNTGVEDGTNLPKIAGVERNEVAEVTKKQVLDSEPEMEDNRPIEEEMDRRYGPRRHGHGLMRPS